MPRRTIAIGDIHGCSDALRALLDAIAPSSDDTIVALGDYIDRGPNSQGVINQLIALRDRCRLIPLLGNHEEVLLDALKDKEALRRWLLIGGIDTLRSYGWAPGAPRQEIAKWIPETHQEFLFGCRSYYETEAHLFLHAGYIPDLPMHEQPSLALRWRVTDETVTLPHRSGKVAVVGHTPQHSGLVLNLGYLICIDTNCVRGGWLTAIDVDTGKIWQTDFAGSIRMGQLSS